ncbi:RB1-inducible coiled-coil protein 1-like [Sinocyclocheilus anshuiensis]|uniref:RB1-inducible coiled-coil protein 1-like n=1 Tax=Sinocyclocheilus anshuiensis TaxID=1608454 RepID=UPI0007B7B599|nr:PREDICTED: RB1-inducible coiled-coil protein 1-like [Sinocyclocheilus anshuiensis]
MAAIQPGEEQSEDSDLRPLISHEQRRYTHQYDTFTVFTGSTNELRFIMLGGDEDRMDAACDIILRERAKRTEIRNRKGHVFGRKICVVKTPSTCMSHKASRCCFESRDKSMKDEMVDYASQVFPGPHAFLLVVNNRKVTEKEHNISKEIANVFGKEALDYVVLLIIGRTEPKGIDSVRKHVNRCYTLEDNEQSVQGLFRETEIMTQNKESTFFIQSSYEKLMKKAFLSWEKEKQAEMRKENERLLKKKEEQHSEKVNELTEKFRIIENKLRNDIAEKDDQHAQDMLKIAETEYNQKRDKETLKCFMIDHFIRITSQHAVQPVISSSHENPLIKKLEADSETNPRNIFSSIIDDLVGKLKTSEETESYLFETFLQRENEQKNKTEELQEEVEQLKAKKSELEKKLMEADERETWASKQVEETLDRNLPTDLDKLQGVLDRQDIQEEHKEKTHVISGSGHESTSPVLSEENKDRPLDKTVREIKSRKEDSQASESHNSGGFKLVRRKSINKPPDMSEDHSGNKDSQASGSMTGSEHGHLHMVFCLKHYTQNVIKHREKELHAKEKELHDRERELDRRVKKLADRQRNLNEVQKQLEIREREVRQRDVRSSEHHQTTADTPSECEGQPKSRDDSQASESLGGEGWKQQGFRAGWSTQMTT